MDEKLSGNTEQDDSIERQRDAAAEIVRRKLDKIYNEEPDASEEIREVKSAIQHSGGSHLSKHEKYMDSLSKSGRGLAEIQTAWHEYYQNLPDHEKHEVWREFYSHHGQKNENRPKSSEHRKPARKHPHKQKATYPQQHVIGKRNPKDDLLSRVAKRSAKSRRASHTHSLLFGLGVGTFVMFIMMFTFFNERFITPFIRPSHNVSATPIIVDPNSSGPAGPEPKIIIPKINVEAPVVYDIPTIDDKTVLQGLERGALHYPTTPNPGENGNAVIFGHSSSNILNKGKYKFVFLLLKSLEIGDTFIIQKDGTRYVYKVYNKFVTNPKDISVLDPPKDGKKAIATLITCDPPGLSSNRLIVQAEQIFPSPAKNKDASVDESKARQPQELPSNAPSLWSRLINSLFN